MAKPWCYAVEASLDLANGDAKTHCSHSLKTGLVATNLCELWDVLIVFLTVWMCNPLHVETLSTFGSSLSLAALDRRKYIIGSFHHSKMDTTSGRVLSGRWCTLNQAVSCFLCFWSCAALSFRFWRSDLQCSLSPQLHAVQTWHGWWVTNDCRIVAAYFFVKASSPVYNMSLFVCTLRCFRVPELPLHFLGRPCRCGGLLCGVSWREGEMHRCGWSH